MVIINEKISDNEYVALDGGFYFGRGVFETILVKNEPLFLKQHLNRLTKGLEALRIANRVNEQAVLKLIYQNKIRDCVMKIIVTEKNVVISTRPLAYKAEGYRHGFRVKMSSLKRNQYSHATYFKTLNYTDNILEKEQAIKEGFDEVLFLNTNQELAEGSASNVFFVLDGKIHTPSIDCGILDGIVRAWVLDHFDVVEGKYPIDMLIRAEEVFLTNCVMGVMSMKSFGGTIYHNFGPVYQKVWEKYENSLRIT